MKKFQVLTDSTSDVEKKYRDELGLDYLKMVFTIDGVEYDADLDWPKMTPKEYYDLMRNGKRSITGLVKTSEFETKFEKYLSEGMDVLYISCSSKLSGSLNNGKIVASELQAKYPNNKIICFDSLRSNYSEGLMAIEASKLATEGMSIDETVAILTNTRLNYQTYATVGTLEYLKKAGRIKASKAFFGNLMGVKPILVTDAIGNNYAFMKTKGRMKSLDEMANQVLLNLDSPEEKTVYVEHADCLDDANYVADKIKSLTNCKEVNISSLGPIIGATTGPDTITISFFGKKVTIAGE